MARLTIRLSEAQMARLETLAGERGQTRAALVRQMILSAIDGVPVEPVDAPTEDELLELLAERARAGNVAAIRSLLARTEEEDPRERALLALEQIVQERRS